MTNLEVDYVPTRVLQSLAPISSQQNWHYYFFKNPIELGELYVMWRNGKKIKELANDDKFLGEHLDKVNLVYEAVKNNQFTDTTLFGMRSSENSPIVITDGIHRAIGIYKALEENAKLRDLIWLRLLLFTDKKISLSDDYKLGIEQK